jgi:phosphate-selective porin OprO/OprP
MRFATIALIAASWMSFAGIAAGQPAVEDPRDALIRDLQERLAALEAQVADLKKDSQPRSEVARARVAAAPRIAPETRAPAESESRVTLEDARPQISTSDGQFRFAVRSLVQFDAASYDQGNAPVPDNRNAGSTASEGPAARDLNSGTVFRRARLGFEGTAFRDWNYAFTAEFGDSSGEPPTLQQAWLEYAGWKPFGPHYPTRLRVGAYTWPTGLEDAMSNADSLFLERPAVADQVRDLAGGDGRSGVGVFANGERWNATAALTGGQVGDSGQFDEQTAVVARLDGLVLRSENGALHLGANVHKIFQLPDTTPPGTAGPAVIDLRQRPELRVDGTRLIDTGDLSADSVLAYGAEFGVQWRNALAMSEVYWIEVDRPGVILDPEFGGWYVEGAWTLTQERRRWDPMRGAFGSVRPFHPFDPARDQWGAFELGARYSVLDLNFNEGVLGAPIPVDGVRGGEQKIMTMGLNWYPNSVIRFLLDALFVDVDRLNPGVFTTFPPDGAQIGQNYWVIALRSQMAF